MGWHGVLGIARRGSVKIEVFERRKAEVAAGVTAQRIPRVLTGMLGRSHDSTDKNAGECRR